MPTVKFSAVVHREGRSFVSWCPELDVASHGKTVEGALENLREAIELYLDEEDVPEPRGTPLITTLEVTRGKSSRAAPS